jgi:hypothetical protein
MNKNQIRQSFPGVIAFADAVRAEFGPGVKLVYASENGHEIGKKSEHDPADVVKLIDIIDNVGPIVVEDVGSGYRGRKSGRR